MALKAPDLPDRLIHEPSVHGGESVTQKNTVSGRGGAVSLAAFTVTQLLLRRWATERAVVPSPIVSGC